MKGSYKMKTIRSGDVLLQIGLAAGMLGVLVLWVVLFSITYLTFDSWAERGVVGDSFGLINSVFSGGHFSV